MKKECPCVTKWRKEIQSKYNTEVVRLDINSDRNCMLYLKYIIPSDYRESKEPRLSKRFRYNEYKEYKFCPFCGKKLEVKE